MRVSIAKFAGCGAAALFMIGAGHAFAQVGEAPQSNIDALKAALDAPGPPTVKPRYGNPGEYGYLGPPGPYFPDRGARMGQGGVAILQCQVKEEGRLSDCAILAEGPTTFSFGAAALKMAKTGYLRASEGGGTQDPPYAVRLVVEFPTPKPR